MKTDSSKLPVLSVSRFFTAACNTTLMNWWFRRPAWTRALIIALVGNSIELVADGTAHSFRKGWFRTHYLEDMVSGLLYFAGGYLLAHGHDVAMRKRTEQML